MSDLASQRIKNENWLLTFDDGYVSDYKIVLPLLVKFNAKALFFIITSKIGSPEYLNWGQVRFLAESGMDIGSHSVSHMDMLSLNQEDVSKELKDSKNIIEDKIGKKIKYFSFPYGRYSKNIVNEAINSGYEYCFSSFPGFHPNNEKLIPRIGLINSMDKSDYMNVINKDKYFNLKQVCKYYFLNGAKIFWD